MTTPPNAAMRQCPSGPRRTHRRFNVGSWANATWASIFQVANSGGTDANVRDAWCPVEAMMLPSKRDSVIGLLLAVAGVLLVAAIDIVVMWAAANIVLTMAVWLGWQVATLGLLAWSVPPLFQKMQSTSSRVIAIVITIVALQAMVSVLGVTCIANAREMFGIPIWSAAHLHALADCGADLPLVDVIGIVHGGQRLFEEIWLSAPESDLGAR